MDSTMVETDLKARIREVLADMPAQPRGRSPVQWGPPGNKARAIHLAARLGKVFDPNCTSCESDLWDELREAVK